MSDFPPGGGDFMRGIFGDLLKLLRTDSPVQWDLAFQLARSVAAGDDQQVGNVDPMERMRFEEMLGICDLHVADITGMTTGAFGALRVIPTTPMEWANRSLQAWRPFLDKLAASVLPPEKAPPVPTEDDLGDGVGDGVGEGELPFNFAQMIGEWAKTMAPAMLGMQVGSIVGHLARRTFGQYELPLPRGEHDDLFVVPSNLASFAEDWSLPPDDVRMWVCISEITSHAVLSRPHVQDRLEMLLLEHARGFQLDPHALQSRLQGTDPTDFTALAQVLGDTPALGQVTETPELRGVRRQLDTLTAMIEGYVEHVTETAAQRMLGAYDSVREALRRRRVERGESERAAEELFGLRLDQDRIDRGMAFVRGVLDRGGESDLAKLWVVERNLPTPAELEAPGLWIERINIPLDEEATDEAGGPADPGSPQGQD